jgi:hypothetical protein
MLSIFPTYRALAHPTKNPQKNRFLCGLSSGIAYRDTGS